jgi:predicted transcriptional regulator
MKQQERSIVLSLRLPENLVKRLNALAEQDLRTRANMIHLLLQEALDILAFLTTTSESEWLIVDRSGTAKKAFASAGLVYTEAEALQL